MAPEVATKLLAHVARQGPAPGTTVDVELSRREREVLRLPARGLGNADIAKRLSLSEGTVRNQLTSIFEKLGVSDRTQAAVIALRHGLVDPEEP